MWISGGKRWLWCGASTFALLVLAAFVWMRVLHHGPPPEIMKDIRAGIAARHIKDPDERLHKYLEGRYGSMTDPVHRQEAFLDFFNVDHVKALQLLVKHSQEANRNANIDAMARWVAGFGASLTPQEREALNTRFRSEEGRAMLKRATAQYNSQDVRYRGSTAPVISQLLRTLNEIEQAR